MRGMIILQGDEEGKKIFIDKLRETEEILIFNQEDTCKWDDGFFENILSFSHTYGEIYAVFYNVDCETTKYLQDYYPFYIVKILPLSWTHKIVDNYYDGKFLLSCKSDSFESDINEVLRLISI